MLSTVKIKPRGVFRYSVIIFIFVTHLLYTNAENEELSISNNGTDDIGTFRSLSCKVNSSSAEIWWSKDHQNVTTKYSHPDNFSSEAELIFNNITLQDFNNYTCNAQISPGIVLNKTYSLYFRVYPTIELNKELEIVRQAENVSLTCKVKGFPIGGSISWSHMSLNHKLSNSENIRIDDGSLSATEIISKVLISNAIAEYNGTYYCVYENMNKELPLVVKSKPSVQFDKLIAIGKSSIFANWTINNGNAPIKKLTFKYKGSNGTTLQTVIDSKASEYIVRKLLPTTRYEDFTIVADNEVGESTDTREGVTTLAQDPEFVPTIMVKGFTFNSVTLGWNDPQNFTDFYHFYNVSVRTRSGNIEVNAYKAYEKPFMVEHLKPGTDYDFQVQACSEFTRICDKWSDAVQGTTMDGASSPPQNITVECNFDAKSRESVVRVTWDAPSEPQGTINEYEVKLSGNATFYDGDGRQSVENIASQAKSIPVTNPKKWEFGKQPPNTNIYVNVCAKNRIRMCGQIGEGSCVTSPSIPDPEELNKASWKAVQKNNNPKIYFMITLPHISQRNGSICCFRVIVVRMQKDEKLKDLVPPGRLNISTYDEVHNSSKGGAYIAEMLETSSSSRYITIGDDNSASEEKRTPCHKCGSYETGNQGSSGIYRRPQHYPTNAPETEKVHRKRHAGSQMRSDVPVFHFKDGPLDADSTYTAYLEATVISVKYGMIRSQSKYFEPPLKGSRSQAQEAVRDESNIGMPGVAVVGSLILALVVVLIALMCVMRWRRKEPSQEYGLSHSFQQWCRRLRGQQPIPSDEPPNLPPVPREQLVAAYIERHKDSDYGFQHEFENLPDRFCDRTANASDLRDNAGKNRYPDIKAYDQTRVKLSVSDGGSDYINANMVVGYKERKKFICAQGPMESTVVDWWRLIWEQHVHLILMLTNVEEYNKTKCAKYWPSEGSINYGDVLVTHYAEKRYSDYLVRSIKLSRNHPDSNGHDEVVKEEREVTQYHYLVWKDFMAPEHPVGIIRFIKRFNEVYTPEKGPILVHCSAGVGRTGTLVALDSLLQQLAEENCVSIFNTICDLRHQRNYLVQSLKQYIFIYRALMEMSQFGDTDVIVTELKQSVEQLKVVQEGREISRMQEEFERLANVIEDRKPISVGASEENRHRNRHETVIPYDRTRVILSPIPGPNKEICTYINASFIEGYDNSEQFIIAQDPMEATVGEFWRMIIEQNVRSIVMLSETGEDKCPRYWPEKDQETSHDYIKVKYMQSQSFPFYYRREFTVSNTKTEDSCLVTQFQYNGWPVGECEVPQVDRGIVELIVTTFKHKEILEKSCGPMVVHCSDGADRSCIFVALTILVQQMMNEPRVDVFSAIRKLRSQRQGLFRNFAQYDFIYRGLVTYAELHVANGNVGH